jgi:hypothetical protein
MLERPEVPTGVSLELINIALNAQSLCLRHAFDHIARFEGPQAASKFKTDLLEALRNGSINMALLEDTATYEFVVGMVEDLPTTLDVAG